MSYSIYYVIRAQSYVAVTATKGDVEFAYAQASWAASQVFIATAYFFCTTIVGIRLNETARGVIDSAFRYDCFDQKSRFSCMRVKDITTNTSSHILFRSSLMH